jgi:hypothetical protein
VERLVFQSIQPCADEVSLQGEETVDVIFSATYSPREGRWLVEASSADEVLTFGTWKVQDDTGELGPLDGVAQSIAARKGTCVGPVAHIAQGMTPPLFIKPTATSAPTPVRTVTTAEQAALRVWAAVYDCFSPRPELSSFTAHALSLQRWMVEGREISIVEVSVGRKLEEGNTTETFVEEREKAVFYGFWQVDATTGDITPWNQTARATAALGCFRKL